MLEQVGDPLGVFDVRFSSGNRLDMRRIDQQEFHLSFQNIPDRLPKHPRRLHGDRLTLVGFEPIAQAVEILQHGAEGLDLASRTPCAV